jgi:hypothetical protein
VRPVAPSLASLRDHLERGGSPLFFPSSSRHREPARRRRIAADKGTLLPGGSPGFVAVQAFQGVRGPSTSSRQAWEPPKASSEAPLATGDVLRVSFK